MSLDELLRAAVRDALVEHDEVVRRIVREEVGRTKLEAIPWSSSPSKYLTTVMVAAVSSFSEKTIRRACGEGELRAQKVRGEWRIQPGDLDTWIANDDCAKMKKPNPKDAGDATARRLLAARAASQRRRDDRE